jgi:phosphoglycolate phosphatase-like HAD superfamily hydrolase
LQLFDNDLELLILDVDGVILELVASIVQCLEAVAKEANLPVRPIKEYFQDVAEGHRHGFSNLLSDGISSFWPWLTTDQTARLAWRFQGLKRLNPWPAIPGSVETVNWFRRQGVPIALCTTNDISTLERILENVGLSLGSFVAAATWEAGYHKPDPRCLNSIFNTAKVPYAHAVYVGDWYPDVELARNAGVRFVAVLSGGVPRRAFLEEGVPNDHILERLAELPLLVCNAEPLCV